MMTMALQANGTFTCGPSFVSNNLSSLPSKTSLLTFKPKASSLHSLITSRRTQRLTAAAELAQAETMDELSDSQLAEEQFEEDDEKVRKVEKPKLVLKFVWMEKNIGLALDQEIPGYGTVPLSPYSFWPRKDAWEDLKMTLESKPWISQKKMIILLNQATDVINLWQQSGGNISS